MGRVLDRRSGTLFCSIPSLLLDCYVNWDKPVILSASHIFHVWKHRYKHSVLGFFTKILWETASFEEVHSIFWSGRWYINTSLSLFPLKQTLTTRHCKNCPMSVHHRTGTIMQAAQNLSAYLEPGCLSLNLRPTTCYCSDYRCVSACLSLGSQ